MSNGFDANIGFTHRQADVLFLSAPWVPPRTESGSRRVQDAITGTCPGEPCFGHRHSKLTLSPLTFGVTQPGGRDTEHVPPRAISNHFPRVARKEQCGRRRGVARRQVLRGAGTEIMWSWRACEDRKAKTTLNVFTLLS